MKRSKRLTIFRVALGLAVAAMLPVAAHAKPMPGPTYWVEASAVKDEHALYGTSETTPVEIPYLSQGAGVNLPELGYVTSTSPDDRAFARTSGTEATPVVSGGGSGIDVDPFAATGFGIALLLAAGMGLAIRHNRRTRLSPA